MFTEPTVFITGAGASWHYGYPTGEDLIKKTKSLAEEIRSFADFSKGKNPHIPEFLKKEGGVYVNQYPINLVWDELYEKCDAFAKRIDSIDPLVIDFFLGQNEDLEEIGKFLISGVITQSYQQYKHSGTNPNRRRTSGDPISKSQDNWIKFIISKVFSDCKSCDDILDNKVSFITFNYDLSFEEKVYQALINTDSFREEAKIRKFIDDRFFHVYGKMGWDYAENLKIYKQSYDNYALKTFLEKKDEYDFYFKNSQNLKIIAPYQKIEECEITDKAKRKIKEARNIYILGYGFDETNNKKLDLSELLNDRKKRVFFTNFEDRNTVNKKTGKLLGDIRLFLSHNSPVHGTYDANFYYEKSTRSVYEALEKDFPL